MNYIADVGITILLYIILGASLNLLLGYAGQISMAQAVFYGIGGYTAGLLTLPRAQATVGLAARGVTSGLGWDWLPAALVAMAVSFVFASVISIPAARRVRGEYLILLTLAFQVILNQLMNSLTGLTGGPYGLTPIPPIRLFGQQLIDPPPVFLVLLGFTVVAVVVCWAIGESPFGRLLKGIREDEVAVRSLGRNTVGAKVLVFGITAAIAGLAGALASYYYSFIAPGNYSLDLSIFIVAVVVLGGSGNLTGTVLGAVILGALRPLLQNVSFIGDANSVPWQGVIYGLGLSTIMLFRPQGLLPEGAGIGTLVRRLSLPLRRRRSRPNPGEPTMSPVSPGGHDVDPTGGRSLPPPAVPGNPAIVELTGLAKTFGGVKAVDRVNMVLRQADITALIGPNGAGKTTLFNLMTGELPADAGRVVLRGADVTGKPPNEIARLGMTRSFQDVRVFQQLSVLQNVAMAVPNQLGENVLMLAVRPVASRKMERQTRERALGYLEVVGMENLGSRLVSTLSFGEQKLVAIARLLATGCDVLLLDEPTSGIDPASVDRMISLVRDLRDFGKTICIVEHSVHVVERLADRAYFLDEGRIIAEGTMKELTSQPHLAEVYFGT